MPSAASSSKSSTSATKQKRAAVADTSVLNLQRALHQSKKKAHRASQISTIAAERSKQRKRWRKSKQALKI
jgi:hypothetical protein